MQGGLYELRGHVSKGRETPLGSVAAPDGWHRLADRAGAEKG